MPRSRLLLSLSITSALVMLLALTGWCGGPVGASSAPQANLQPGNFGGQSAGGDGGAGNGLSLSGGVGSASVNGADGTSPYVNFEDVGIKNSQILQTWDWRLAYQFPAPGCQKSFARVTGQWDYIYFKASQGSYTGPIHPFLTGGQSLEAKLTLNIWSVNGDFFLGDMGNWWGEASAIKIGPRLQWMNYNDRFKLTNEFTGLDDSRSRSYAMFGFGLVGEIDLAKLVGMRYGFTGPQHTQFSPVLGFLATVGGSGNMRYDTWEVSLKLISSPILSSVWGCDGPKLSGSFGIMGFRFKQTLDRVTGAIDRPSSADFRMTIPFGAATITF
jgi:hypothetical protein